MEYSSQEKRGRSRKVSRKSPSRSKKSREWAATYSQWIAEYEKRQEKTRKPPHMANDRSLKEVVQGMGKNPYGNGGNRDGRAYQTAGRLNPRGKRG